MSMLIEPPATSEVPVAASPSDLDELRRRLKGKRVAIAHDYLTQRGGAERVVLAMSRAFPEATIYTTLYNADTTFPEFRDRDVVVSPLNRVAAFRNDHRRALPALAVASSRLRIEADVVIASSSGWAHGFSTEGKVVVYCHTPARWLYLTEQYLGQGRGARLMNAAIAPLVPSLRRWDKRAAERAHTYIANSSVVRERIGDVYGFDAHLLFPPHSVDTTGELEAIDELAEFSSQGHFLIVSRLLPYKNVHRAIEAFRDVPAKRLLIVGDGPMRDELARNLPANVRLVSGISDAQLRWAYANSIALIAPSHEDFGLTVLEAAAWGRPTLALRAGGYLDTVVPGVTGAFFERPDAPEIRDAVASFDASAWSADAIREHAAAFSEERFAARLVAFASRALVDAADGVEVRAHAA